MRNAAERGWTVDADRLDDRRIVRRMVLKRCVYGVDRNPMAVELAKVSLWLHTFTAGAPLSFLDHHLRCGNSLFGCSAREAFEKTAARGSPLFLHEPLNRATRAAMAMQTIEELSDAEIEETSQSSGLFEEIVAMTGPLDAFLALMHAFEWLDVRDADGRTALRQFLQGAFGDPVGIAAGQTVVPPASSLHERFIGLLDDARAVAAEERFLNWQPAFPGVWTDWDAAAWQGGFDAVIGNPPWDRMKLQQVEWFAARCPAIARQPRAADRRRMVAALEETGEPLAHEYRHAAGRAETAARVARRGGKLSAAVRRRRQPLFAVRRARAVAGPAGRTGRTGRAVGHRRRQDGGAFLPERGDRRTAAGAVRLREPSDAIRRAAVLPRHCTRGRSSACFVAGRAPAVGSDPIAPSSSRT